MKYIFRKVTMSFIAALLFSFCSFSQVSVTVQVYYGGYGEECSWNITRNSDSFIVLSGNAGTSNSFSYNGNINLLPGYYTFNAFDSYGDGWTDPNGWYQITPAYGISTGQVYFSNGSTQSTPFAVYYYSAIDLGVSSWISPLSGPSLSNSQQITIAVKNYGTNSVSSYSISYSINNGSSFITQSISSSLSPGSTVNQTFTQTANFSNPGVYHCKAVVHVSGDSDYINDTLSVDVNSIQTVSTFPWNVTFNSWPLSGWSQQGGSHNWALYTSGSLSCVFCNFYVWPSGNAVMITPPINLSTPSNLKFNWSKGFDQNYLNDELNVSASIDGGLSWTTIWDKAGADLNSNDGATSTAPGTFTQMEVIDLSQFSNHIVYIKFNGISGYGYNLFLDNVSISTYPPGDMAAVQWISPQSTSCGLSSSEPVVVKIQNLGSQTVNNFVMGYSINGGLTYTTQPVSVSVTPGAYYTHTFTQHADFSALGIYNCKFFVHVANDSNSANDTLSGVIVKNLSLISTFPFTENFESGTSNYFNIQANEYALASIVQDGSTKALKLEGNSETAGWIGGYSGSGITTHDNAWINNISHQSWGITCNVDASSLSTCELLINLKQYYKYGPKYSWFRVLVNNVQIADMNGTEDFNPVTSYSDPYTTRYFNLNAYAGTQFTLTVQGSNKLSSASYPPGNVALIDNITIQQAPGNDLAVTGLVSPLSGCSLSSNEHFTIAIHNNSSVSMSNFPVSFSTNGGSSYTNETVTTSVNSGATLNYTFIQAVNLSATGTTNVIFSVNLPGDVNTVNDTLVTSVTHYPSTSVNFTGLAASYCINSNPVILTGSPSGGTFTGPGVAGGSFYPSNLVAGNYSIVYSYTNSFGCTSQAVQSVTVNGVASSFSGLASQYCINYASVTLSGTPVGGSFNGTGISGQTFTPSVAGTGNFTISYSYTTAGCTTTSNHQVTVNSLPVPTISQNQNACIGNAVTLSTSQTYSLYYWSNGASNSSINVTQSGTYSVIVTDSNGCTGYAQLNVAFSPLPVIDLGPDITACNGNPVSISAGFANSYLWSDGSTSQGITVTTAGNYSVTITNNGCSNNDNINIYFHTVTVNLGNDASKCQGSTITISPGVYNSYLWSNGSSGQSLVVSQPGLYSITVTDASGCFASDNIIISDFPVPAVNAGQDISIYDNQPATLSATPGFVSYHWSNGATTQSLNITGSQLGVGAHSFWVSITDSNGCSNSDTVVVTVLSSLITQTLTLNSGWSMFSFYLSPVNPSMASLFAPVVSNVSIIKDGIGRVYWPVYGINQIGNDTTGAGYQLRMTADLQLQVTGNIIIPELTPLTILQGWSIMGYLRTTPALITSLLSSIVNHVNIVKDESGQVYWPFYGFNNIGNMLPGKAYQFNMISTQTLIYPPDGSSVPALKDIYKKVPVHYAVHASTGNSMTLGILFYDNMPINKEYEVALFDEDGICIGSAVSDERFIAVTAWGKDEMTRSKDGLLSNEQITARLWDGNKEWTLFLLPENRGDDRYTPDKISVIRCDNLTTSLSSLSLTIISCTPDPFILSTSLRVFLPVRNDLTIEIYNMLGDLQSKRTYGELPAGINQITISRGNMDSGNYLFRVVSGGKYVSKVLTVED
ncbi:MAG: T9SS type A sorting domain-containing protein [Bacteroidia bacterium]|nr:T9SS type A sorting domain-containing protein [Bacteroidia bacterium]